MLILFNRLNPTNISAFVYFIETFCSPMTVIFTFYIVKK